MTQYQLKALPVQVFTWQGQDPATWPEWTKSKILGVLMVPGWAPNLAIKNGDSAWIMPQGESLVLYPDGSIRGFKPAELELEVELAPSPSPSPTPAPGPTPATALPQQPYEPIDRREVNGVMGVQYYATASEPTGKEYWMPLEQWFGINPKITTGLRP